MIIAGIGTVCAAGTGIDSFESALRNGWRMPSETEARWAPGGKTFLYRADLDAVPDKSLLRKVRRADKLSKMSVLAAAEALRDGGVKDAAGLNLGIIMATGLGAHVTTFGFLDTILDYGDAAVSPTTFSNSVHNAAASYVSSALNIKGPTVTVTQFRTSFQAALQLAGAWLGQGRCDAVLVGAAEQHGDVLGYVSEQKLTTASDGRIKPFVLDPSSTSTVPGEGAAFFLLVRDGSDTAYCTIRSAAAEKADDGIRPDLVIIDADGMLPDESVYLSALGRDVPAAAYSPIVGGMMTVSAFNVAAAALMLRNQILYAAPVLENPHGFLLVSETRTASIRSITAIGYNCYAEQSLVCLTSL